MDTKQKSLLILTVAALGFLGYQIFQLVDRDITESPIVAETTVTAPVAPLNPVVKKPMSMQSQPQQQTDTLNQGQHAYVQMLNQFELVKLHRQLLDEEAAVATAQNQIAQLHSQTAKITGPDSDNSALSGEPTLNYIDQQNGQWSATLHIGTVYQSVSRGSILSNGYQVIDISHQGVTLQKNQSRELLTFDGVTQLPALSVVQPIAKPVVAVTPTPAPIVKLLKTSKPIPAASITPAVAKKVALLSSGPKQTIVVKTLVKVDSPQTQALKPVPVVKMAPKKPIASSIQLSIHDKYAQEDEDDLQNKELSEELHLPSVEIRPVVDQEAYNVDSYLAQQVNVPQTYHLDAQASASTDEDQYASESSDDLAPMSAPVTRVHKHIVIFPAKSLLAQPANYYTIQLIGSRNSGLIHHYVQANKLEHTAVVLPLRNGKHPWTIAVYGVFTSEAAAEVARSHLPKHLSANGAWVRKIGDIQKDA